MKCVFTDENPALVGYARSIAENEGIPVTLRNEFSAGGMAPPYNIWQELWVLNDADYEQARELLAPLGGQPPQGE